MDVREQVRQEVDRLPVGVLVRQLQNRRALHALGTTSAATASPSVTFVTTSPSVTVPATGTYLVIVQAQTDGPCVVSASGAGVSANDDAGFYTPAGQTGVGLFAADLAGGGVLSLAFRSTDGGSRTLLRPRVTLVPA